MRSFKGHEKGVKSVAFSPDGSYVVSGSLDCTVRLWDLSNGATISVLRGHSGTVDSVQFAPNEPHVISGSQDRSIRIWNTSDGTLIRLLRKAHSQGITSIAVSSDGSRIVSGSRDRTTCVWDTRRGELTAGPFKSDAEVRSVGFSGDGVRVISVDQKIVRVWNAQGIPHAQNDSNKIWRISAVGYMNTDIASSQSQTHVAFRIRQQVEDSKLHVWDLRTITHVVIQTNAIIRHFQFSFDGARIFSLYNTGFVCTWDVQTAKLLGGPHRFTSASTIISRLVPVACSTDGTRVVTCHGNKAELWHVKSNRSIALCETSCDKGQVLFTQDGSRFVTCSGEDYDCISEVWDGETGTRVAGPFPVKVLDLSPDGTYLCCLSRYHFLQLQLIQTNTGETIDILQKGSLHSTVFTPDGLYMATKGDYPTINILNIRGQTVASYDLEAGRLENSTILGYSSCGRLLLSSHHDGEGGGFHVWRIPINRPAFSINQDGWVLDNQGQPLIWVPTEIRKGFSGCSGVIVSHEVLQIVDYSDMLVGDDWNQCYSPGSQSTCDVTE
ncbi:hypothetical protein ACGC1H_003492 [Rhizoctonia solani]